MYSENIHVIHIAIIGLQSKKNRDINRQPAVANNQNWSFTSRGATVGLGLRLWLTRSIVPYGGRNLPFSGNLAEKASCVDDKTVLFRYK